MVQATPFEYLFDTDVLSAFAPGRTPPQGAPDVAEWIIRHDRRLYMSAVTIGEVRAGICKLERTGSTQRAARLSEWLHGLTALYGPRILPVDVTVAYQHGELADKARGAGHACSYGDIAIAATAVTHGLVVLTHNVRHFEPLGVAVHDPFTGLPPNH
ncbi:type II toxin-antitoxin system VapC family toxin [Xanthobacteraceae bacterium A53D]